MEAHTLTYAHTHTHTHTQAHTHKNKLAHTDACSISSTALLCSSTVRRPKSPFSKCIQNIPHYLWHCKCPPGVNRTVLFVNHNGNQENTTVLMLFCHSSTCTMYFTNRLIPLLQSASVSTPTTRNARKINIDKMEHINVWSVWFSEKSLRVGGDLAFIWNWWGATVLFVFSLGLIYRVLHPAALHPMPWVCSLLW